MLYSRPQLKLLLLLGAILLAGLGVKEWRAGFPDLAERLERLDLEEPAAAPLVAGRPEGGESPAGSRGPRPAPDPPKPVTAAADPRPLDLNRATLEEIARLPGVGPGLARRILDERERRGRFDSPEALRQVLGLGPKKLGALRELVTVSD